MSSIVNLDIMSCKHEKKEKKINHQKIFKFQTRWVTYLDYALGHISTSLKYQDKQPLKM